MFSSRWDGDELSLVQAHHQLRAARRVDVRVASDALDRALAPLARLRVDGLGLYRVVHAGAQAAALVATLATHAVRTHALPNGGVPIAPPLDRALADASALALGIAAYPRR